MFFKPPYVICFLILVTVTLIYMFSQLFSIFLLYMRNHVKRDVENSWVFRLFLNALGYITISLPFFFLYLYVQKSKLADKPDRNCLNYLLRECFVGSEKKNFETSNIISTSHSFVKDAIKLSFCCAGLLIAYLIWGLLQERMMTQVYLNTAGESEKFKNSEFLVLVNRVLAFLLSGICIFARKQPRHTVPIYKYIYCSFSNIMSSWCQYEALKFISFPAQVLSKACKLIPVMLMSKVISKRNYEYYEYVTAIMICIGMALFISGSSDVTADNQTMTTISGVILLIIYMVFDSFTSSWQSELFKKYSTSSLQMMFAVNFFSSILTSVSLMQQEGFMDSLLFSVKFPSFAFDCFLLSVCSAIGQLFVYYTISGFGPVVFTIIMIFRQVLAIILSCITYHHFINPLGIFGIIIIFIAIFLRTYCSHKVMTLRKKVISVSINV